MIAVSALHLQQWILPKLCTCIKLGATGRFCFGKHEAISLRIT